MIERRHIARFELKVLARLILYASGRKKEMLQLYTKNICTGGAFLETNSYVPEGTNVQMDFVLPINKIIELIGASSYVKINGKVVRSEEKGIAIMFDKDYEIMPYKN